MQMRNSALRVDAIAFLFVAFVAAVVGYGNVAHYSWEGAKALVFVSLALAAICLYLETLERAWQLIRVSAGSHRRRAEP